MATIAEIEPIEVEVLDCWGSHGEHLVVAVWTELVVETIAEEDALADWIYEELACVYGEVREIRREAPDSQAWEVQFFREPEF